MGELRGYVKCTGCWQMRPMHMVKEIRFKDGERIKAELECLNPDWGVMDYWEDVWEPDELIHDDDNR